MKTALRKKYIHHRLGTPDCMKCLKLNLRDVPGVGQCQNAGDTGPRPGPGGPRALGAAVEHVRQL